MGNPSDPIARSLCDHVDETLRSMPELRPLIKIDSGTTKTDFSDPLHPAQRTVDADGNFTDVASDGVNTDEECYQAALKLSELAAADIARGSSALLLPMDRWSTKSLQFFKGKDFEVPWTPTDPIYFSSGTSLEPLHISSSFLEKASSIWNDTAAISDARARKRAFAEELFNKMAAPLEEGGFGIRFYNPVYESGPANGHPFYSTELTCMGTWIYGVLCELYGIEAVPIQRYTDAGGEMQDHVLVGLRLNPDDRDDLIFAGFMSGESGFGVSLAGSIWAPISKLELLAYVHLNRAFDLFPNDRKMQLSELNKAYRLAPHNYLVQYQFGVWHMLGGDKKSAMQNFLRSRELFPFYENTLEAIEYARKAR